MLATTGKKLNKDATKEEKKFHEECIHDYEIMKETAKKHGIKNPVLEIPMEVDFLRNNATRKNI